MSFEENMVSELVEKHGLSRYMLAECGAMLAGGAINSIYSNRPVKDLDFYCKTQDQYEELIKQVALAGYKLAFRTDNAATFYRTQYNHRQEVQVITRFTGDPDTILNTFDFTIVQGLYDFETNQFNFSARFLSDIAKRQLIFTNTSQYPICALYRTKKYQDRGYELSGATIVAISMAINALEFKTFDDLKAQLMGIDTSIFKKLADSFDSTMSFELGLFMQEWNKYAFGFSEETEVSI